MLKIPRTLHRRKDATCLFQALFYHARSGVFGFKARQSQESNDFAPTVDQLRNRTENANVFRLVEAYRQFGHKKARLDPLGITQIGDPPELSLSQFGLTPNQTVASLDGIYNGSQGQITVSDLITQLEHTYCSHVAGEFSHLQTEEERNWFAAAMETKGHMSLQADRRVDLAKLMLRCQAFDHFLANKFTTVKRYGGEGGESMMGVFDEVFRKSASNDMSDVVLCMPHRGRLNFLTCMLDFPPVLLFRKMQGKTELPEGAKGTGDVLSHSYTSVDLEHGGKSVHVSIIPNPSHLEANNPVAVGKTRAKQLYVGEGDYAPGDEGQAGEKVLCVQVHGDASFTGQGIVAETFCIAECPHYRVGGSIHLIVNNQIGFTTESLLGRSSKYASDQAKINGYPVLHVNGDSPEDVIRATAIAMDYRHKFHRDVIIDLICFRKWGHNEIDDPTFTQPIMYHAINSRSSIPDLYAKQLVSEGVCKSEDLDTVVQTWNSTLLADLAKADSHVVQPKHLQKQWSHLVQASDSITTWDTGVRSDVLKFVGAMSVHIPEHVKVHPTIQKSHVERRRQRMVDGAALDWSAAEALAMGSLIYQGYNVRISGQDVGRATFSHRHAMIVDQENDSIYIPLNHMTDSQSAHLEVANSALTEEAVLGFEYGFSMENPNTLVIWEAQFGDFFNGAQSIIDTYISSGEDKWLLQNGLVMLLPHGMDGAGPEHSSCRMERFLQMCSSHEDGIDGDHVNFQVANPTTPAQYFHLLRRQMVRNFRKPLVMVAPKVLLRLPAATSSLADMAPGTNFLPVLGDPKVKADSVTKVIFVSGKHYYTLVKERETRGLDNVAVVRLESLCPFPAEELRAEIKKYSKASEFVWSQEEHRNMGAWTFVAPRFQNIVGVQLKYAGRCNLGVPATAIGEIHRQESAAIIEQTFQ
ncbi:probable 2-oxoglutarate dehydrogenase E1 component DHKTD1, mitochondrial isoform X1 [Haliotis rufescens]|uniref:probable 2-oxoglutarate dehydrogenase E1 component DHKTD1, mitochondrial isoform X1 n=1 Tax=Haliotis rufescens TaxID=6454 RepID=UPI00201EC9F2|nr:probable 2-oxoglutarate dehydrogenase E1 component DHKTD1, mitochondrial isoform X1 [Haliotis rufescens]